MRAVALTLWVGPFGAMACNAILDIREFPADDAGSGSAGRATGSPLGSGSSPSGATAGGNADAADGSGSGMRGGANGSGASGAPSGAGTGVSAGTNGGVRGERSCQTTGSGLTHCGTNGDSCCTSLEVMGGTYYRTYTNSGSGPTGEADPATITGFRMDKYLVTVGRFRQFVSAWDSGAGYTPAAGSGKHTHLNGGNGLAATAGGYEPGWLVSDGSHIMPTNGNLACDARTATWTNEPGANETLPMNCVNWWEAYAFCIWDGGFLPSEAEWEYAAAAGGEQRQYPWGAMNPGTASQYAIYGCGYPNGSGTCTGWMSIAPVGTAALGAGFWGQLDLAGDTWEWNLDWYAPYAECADCADLSASTTRTIRGGYFGSVASDLLPPLRGRSLASNRNLNLGFRCSRTP